MDQFGFFVLISRLFSRQRKNTIMKYKNVNKKTHQRTKAPYRSICCHHSTRSTAPSPACPRKQSLHCTCSELRRRYDKQGTR